MRVGSMSNFTNLPTRPHSNFLHVGLLALLGLALLTLGLGVLRAEGAPDFGVTDQWIALDTLNPQTGEELQVSAHIENSGDDQGNVTLEFWDDYYDAGKKKTMSSKLGERQVADLSAGAHANVTFDWTIPQDHPLGDRQIRVQLESNDDQNDANNAAVIPTILYRGFSTDAGDIEYGTGSSKTFQTYLQDGHMLISGSGNVTLAGGAFDIDQDRDNQFFIELSGSGRLTIEDGAALRSNRALTIYLMDDSAIIVQDRGSIKAARIVARDRSWLEVKHGTIQAGLDLDVSKFTVRADSTVKGTSGKILSGTVKIHDSSIEFETLSLEATSDLIDLDIAGSTFDLEDSLLLRAPGSTIVDSSFTRPLIHFDEGSHILTNVATPWVAVSGTADLERWWYLTVQVTDIGQRPVDNATVVWEYTIGGGGSEIQTDEEGMATLPLLANHTTPDGDDFMGNYLVKATFDIHSSIFKPVTLKSNTDLSIQFSNLRQTKALDIRLELRTNKGPLGNQEIEAGDPFIARVWVEYDDPSRDPAAGFEVSVTVDGKRKEMTTDADGILDFEFDAPDGDSSKYKVKATVTYEGGERTVTKELMVEEGPGTLDFGTLMVIIVLLLIVTGVIIILIQKVSLSYATPVAQCGGCGQRIPLDSETCPECGEKLDPFEAFDMKEESNVSRDGGV